MSMIVWQTAKSPQEKYEEGSPETISLIDCKISIIVWQFGKSVQVNPL